MPKTESNDGEERDRGLPARALHYVYTITLTLSQLGEIVGALRALAETIEDLILLLF